MTELSPSSAVQPQTHPTPQLTLHAPSDAHAVTATGQSASSPRGIQRIVVSSPEKSAADTKEAERAVPAAPTLTKHSTEERAHLKHIAWEPIHGEKRGEFWNQVKSEDVDEEDAKELTAMFAVKPASPMDEAIQARIEASRAAAGEKPTSLAHPQPVRSAVMLMPIVPRPSESLSDVSVSGVVPARPEKGSSHSSSPASFLQPTGDVHHSISYSPSDSPRTRGVGSSGDSTRHTWSASGRERERESSTSRDASPTSVTRDHSLTHPAPKLHVVASTPTVLKKYNFNLNSAGANPDATYALPSAPMAASWSPKSGTGTERKKRADSLDVPTNINKTVSLGEMLRSSTPKQRVGGTQSVTAPSTPRFSGAGPEMYTRQLQLNELAQATQAPKRSATPQPRGRTMGLHQEVRIDRDLMPNFVFLKEGKKLQAASLPPPQMHSPCVSPKSPMGSRSPSESRSPSSLGAFARARTPMVGSTPRNMELGAMHAHAGGPIATRKAPTFKLSDPYREPSPEMPATRRWTITAAKDMEGQRTPPAPSVSVGSPPIQHHHLGSGGTVPHIPAGIMSPPSHIGPVVLGQGILSEVNQCVARVAELMNGPRGGVVHMEDDAIVELISEYRSAFARASAHDRGAFVTQLLQRKYNTDTERDSHVFEHMGSTDDVMKARTEDAALHLPDRDLGVAIPFAPQEWFFDPSNLSGVLVYHLVLQTIDWGLEHVPLPPPERGAIALLPSGSNPRDVLNSLNSSTAATSHQPQRRPAYSSADLARSLANVLRSNPRAFTAERLSQVDELRLGSWLQPHVLQEALQEHPEFRHDADLFLGSPGTVLSEIRFTFPNLSERARMLRELGVGLLKHFSGDASLFVEKAAHSACTLVELLTQHFPSFREAHVYAGCLVPMHTRAQSFARNLWVAFHGEGAGRFTDLADLCPRSDRELPRILHALGVLKYSRELNSFLRARTDLTSLPADVEVELRCATTQAIRRMCDVMHNVGVEVMPIQMDLFLRSHVDPLSHTLHPFFLSHTPSPCDDASPSSPSVDVGPPIPLPRAHVSTSLWY